MIKHLRFTFASISGAEMFLHDDERLKVMVAVSITSAVKPHVYQADAWRTVDTHRPSGPLPGLASS